MFWIFLFALLVLFAIGSLIYHDIGIRQKEFSALANPIIIDNRTEEEKKNTNLYIATHQLAFADAILVYYFLIRSYAIENLKFVTIDSKMIKLLEFFFMIPRGTLIPAGSAYNSKNNTVEKTIDAMKDGKIATIFVPHCKKNRSGSYVLVHSENVKASTIKIESRFIVDRENLFPFDRNNWRIITGEKPIVQYTLTINSLEIRENETKEEFNSRLYSILTP